MWSRIIEPAKVRIQNALDIACRYSQIDGEHHKAWTIDQMVRALFETEEDYKQWIVDICEGGEYDWDEGIAP